MCDRVLVEVDAQERTALKALKSGDVIRQSNTVSYNGLYRVGAVRNGTFTIDAPWFCHSAAVVNGEALINSTHSDLSDLANASDGFASWQRKLETLQIRQKEMNEKLDQLLASKV